MRSSIKLQLVVVFLIVVGVGLLSTYMLAGSRSYSEMLDKCVNRCSERGMFGRLVRPDKPYSPRQTIDDYECKCY
jgi:hypothetical protein